MPDAPIQRLFIADAHLDGTDTPRALALRAMLERLAANQGPLRTELYILGDLFEFWEEYHGQVAQLYEKDLAAFEAAARTGVQINLLAGNRDFLYGHYVKKRLNAVLWGDGGVVTLSDSRKAWIEHGDLLCTADTRYLRFRWLIRSWPVRLYFRLKSWDSARSMLERIAQKTKEDKAQKDTATFDIDPTAARARLETHGCRLLLCGHTHKPQATDVGHALRLIVLPAWCDTHAGYRDQDGALAPFWVPSDGALHRADEKGVPRHEASDLKRKMWF